METIYTHTRFLDKQNASFFFLGEFSNIDFYCVKHNHINDLFRFLALQKTGATFDIQYLVHTLKENYMWQIGLFP